MSVRYYSKISLFVVMLSALVLSAGSLRAEDSLRVGFVDLEQALSASKAGASAQKQYETSVRSAQGKLDKKKKELERLQKEFVKQRESLSEDARLSKQEKLIGLEKDLKRSFQDSQEALQRQNAQLVGDLIKKIRKAVKEVGEEKGFTLILEKGDKAVLYADSAIDITGEVVKKFNASEG